MKNKSKVLFGVLFLLLIPYIGFSQENNDSLHLENIEKVYKISFPDKLNGGLVLFRTDSLNWAKYIGKNGNGGKVSIKLRIQKYARQVDDSMPESLPNSENELDSITITSRKIEGINSKIVIYNNSEYELEIKINGFVISAFGLGFLKEEHFINELSDCVKSISPQLNKINN